MNMNTIKKQLLGTVMLIATMYTYGHSQAPQKMSYQAVIRNPSNALVTNTMVGVRASILQGTPAGNPV